MNLPIGGDIVKISEYIALGKMGYTKAEIAEIKAEQVTEEEVAAVHETVESNTPTPSSTAEEVLKSMLEG